MKKLLLIATILMFFTSPAHAVVERITMGGALGQDLDLNDFDITNFSSSGGLIAPYPYRFEDSAAFTLEYGDRGSLIFVSAGSDLGATTTITFSSAANFSQNAGVLDSLLVINAGAGTIVFASAGSEDLRLSGGAVTGIEVEYNQASFIFYDSATAYITGGIQ